MTWHLDSVPVFSLGAVEGEQDQLLSRVHSVTLLGDSAVLFVDAGSFSVRVVNRRGETISRFGAQGDGPGEFRAIWAAWLQGHDSVGVLDLGASRWAWFSLAGELQSTQTFVPGEGRGDLFEGAFSDGGFVLSMLQYPSGSEGGIGVGSMPHSLITPEGVFGGRIAETPGVTFYLPRSPTSPTGMSGVPTARHPFSPKPLGTVVADTLYFGDAVQSSVSLYTQAGLRARDVHLDLTRVDRSQAVHRLDSATAALGRIRTWTDVPEVEHVPTFMGLEVDDRSRIWVREYRPEVDSPWVRETGWGYLRNFGGTWSVFSPTGDLVGRLRLPPDFHVEHIRGNLIAGVAVDDLGIERVQVYKFHEVG